SSMAALGHEVSLLLLHESVRKETVVQTEPFRIAFFPVTFAIPLARFGGDFSLPLLRAVRDLGAEALHVHGCFYDSLPWLVRAARLQSSYSGMAAASGASTGGRCAEPFGRRDESSSLSPQSARS